MITIAELPAYIRKVEKKLNEEEQDELKNFLAINPLAGDVIEGTGGLRKLRWSVGNKGKSGGVRIIYYFYNEILPLYLITSFMKNEKVNLTKSERNELAKLVEMLKKSTR